MRSLLVVSALPRDVALPSTTTCHQLAFSPARFTRRCEKAFTVGRRSRALRAFSCGMRNAEAAAMRFAALSLVSFVALSVAACGGRVIDGPTPDELAADTGAPTSETALDDGTVEDVDLPDGDF